MITILDGGMGRELERIGAPFRQPEWSALSLMQKPEAIRQAHDNFIAAGADVITTNTYACVPFHIGQDVFDRDGRRLIRLAAQIARESADAADHPVQVAGCLPPLFGSYRHDNFDPEIAPSLLAPLIEEQENFVDFWLAETIAFIHKAEFLCASLNESDKPIWLSFTVDDELTDTPILRSGETVTDAIKTAASFSNVQAILFNCSQPETMRSALETAKKIGGNQFRYGVYANAFDKIKSGHKANEGISGLRDLTPEIYLDYAHQWVSAGATIIGGCCGIGPSHIRLLCDNLNQVPKI